MSVVVLNKQSLGQAEWNVLHAHADTVTNRKSLICFMKIAECSVMSYPCHECREHVQEFCGNWLAKLQFLPGRAALLSSSVKDPNRIVAVAWAASLHACVSLHLIHDPKAYVSQNSIEIASQIKRVENDDVAIANLLVELRA